MAGFTTRFRMQAVVAKHSYLAVVDTSLMFAKAEPRDECRHHCSLDNLSGDSMSLQGCIYDSVSGPFLNFTATSKFINSIKTSAHAL